MGPPCSGELTWPYGVYPGYCQVMDTSVREAAEALLRVQSDLRRLLSCPPNDPQDRHTWCDGVSAAMIEAARGRLYLSRLTSSGADGRDPRYTYAAEGEERLAS